MPKRPRFLEAALTHRTRYYIDNISRLSTYESHIGWNSSHWLTDLLGKIIRDIQYGAGQSIGVLQGQ